MPKKSVIRSISKMLLLVHASFGLIASPPPLFPIPGSSRWISGHKAGEGCNVRANKGEIVTFKFCMLNINQARKIFIVIKMDSDPGRYVQNGLEIVEQPHFAKDDFAIQEAQTCMMKIRVNSIKYQLLDVIFVDESRDTDPKHLISVNTISFNDPSYNNAPLQPWDETDLCKEPYIKRN